MQFRPVAIALAEVPCQTRVPFRFGSVTLERGSVLHARVELESVDGRSARGAAADLLVPRWFRKDLDRGADEDQRALKLSAETAAETLLRDGRDYARVFDLWHALYQSHVRGADPTDPGLLERGFGAALIERAMLDAACRLSGQAFWSALQTDLFGVRLGALHEELADTSVPEVLAERPRTRFLLRHTVGMLDPLRSADVPPEERLDDGLPQSLEDYLRTDGVRWLKIKVGQGLDADRARLLAIAALCRDAGPQDLQFTLDGNEQFEDLAAVADLLDAVDREPQGREFLQRLRFVEQPLARARTFDDAGNRGIERVTARAPLVLDEADTSLAAFPEALRRGWRGCSVKNCKGVFRALANQALARRHDGAFLSAEDLTNLPLLPLQQDLATQSVLGLEHVERNGHHYFRGLDHLPAAVRAAALRAHPDLYQAGEGGTAQLRIEDGALTADSLLGKGYGCDQEAFDALLDALSWTPVAVG